MLDSSSSSPIYDSAHGAVERIRISEPAQSRLAPPLGEPQRNASFALLAGTVLEPASHDGDVPSDEELPDYDTSTALPAYEGIYHDGSSTPTQPLMTYHLRQLSRNVQILVPFGPSPHHSYRIRARSGPRLFGRKKADFTLTRVNAARTNSIGSTSTATPSLLDDEEETAWMNFVSDGKLPYMPKANVTVKPRDAGCESSTTVAQPSKSLRSIHMTAPNFRDWRIHLPNLTQPYQWHLLSRPTALELHPPSLLSIAHTKPVACFLPSRVGSRASAGAEVGVVEIFQTDHLPGELNVETIIASCTIVLANLRSMGRHIWR